MNAERAWNDGSAEKKQKHLIHLHQNNYEAKRWGNQDGAVLVCTNTPAAERKIKIKEKMEKKEWKAAQQKHFGVK